MQANVHFESAELDQLRQLDDQTYDLAIDAEARSKERSLDLCETIRMIIPILKGVETLICIIPFTRKACKAVRKVLDLLESAC